MEMHSAHVTDYLDYLQEVRLWSDASLEADQWAAMDDIAPVDAAMLLCRHNPNESQWGRISSDETGATSYEELDNNRGRAEASFPPERLRMLARRLSDINATDLKKRTLRDWHQVAREKKLAYHSWVDVYMEATAPPLAETAAPEPQAAPVGDWVELARTRAREIVKKQRTHDLYPNQESIGDTIAAEFRKAGTLGTDGKPLTGATIKRHALKGISSAVGKRLSTTIRQGK